MKCLVLSLILCAAEAVLYADNTAYYKCLTMGKLTVQDAASIESKVRNLANFNSRTDIKSIFPNKIFRISEDTNGKFRFDEVEAPRLVIPEFRNFVPVKIYDLASAGNIAFIQLDARGFFTNTDAVCRIEDKSSYGYVIFEKMKGGYAVKAFYFSEDNVPGE